MLHINIRFLFCTGNIQDVLLDEADDLPILGQIMMGRVFTSYGDLSVILCPFLENIFTGFHTRKRHRSVIVVVFRAGHGIHD